MPDLHRPDRAGVQDRPVHLTCAARSRPPSKRSISDAAPGSRGSSPRGAEPLRRGRRGLPGRPGGCRAPCRRAPGGPHAPRVRRMRAPESDRRRAGQDGAHHQAAAGNPVPARPARAATPAAARCGPALGGRLHPRADPARGSSLHRLRHGACARRPHRRPGPPAAARGTDNAVGAPGQAIRARKDREGGDPPGPGPPQRPRIQATCPSPTPDDSSTRAPVASAGAVGSSYLTWLIVGRLGCWGLVVGGIVRVAWVEVRTNVGV